MTDKRQWGYEELVAECKRLRSESERSEARFFAFLMVVEREHAATWQAAGCTTFEQFVRSNNLCEMYSRYALFRDGVDRVGLDAALENGAHWTMAVGKVREAKPEVIEQFRERADAFREVHHTAPSEQVVRGWSLELGGRQGPVRVQQQASELHQLRATVAKLTADLKAAQRRVKELESENAKLKAKGVAKAKPSEASA